MAKSNMDAHWDNVEAFRYRWEFLRLNPDYRKDYEVWKKFKKPSWDTPKSPFLSMIKKYGFPPLDYKKNYEELSKDVEKYFNRKRSNLSFKQEEQRKAYEWFRVAGCPTIVDYMDDKGLEKDENNPLYKSEHISLTVNLEYPKEIILKEVGNWVDLFKWVVSETESEKGRQRKTSYKKYNKYLIIYDLVKNEGKKYKEIVDIAFKEDINKDKGQDGLIVKAKRQFKEAERLVMGGYKEIK